jgi:two-component system, chemotaxis family, protein-glutamate methylesterase/glutaminase
MPRDDTSVRVSADPIRVLVVDDQRFMRIALRQIIESEGDIRVVGEARTGVEAVAMARELKPDAVTMDIEMPEMDGLDACASIMREVTPKPAIIMVSAHTQAGAAAAVRALHLGAVDFVSKTSIVAKTDLARIDAELRPKLRAWSTRHRQSGATVAPVSVAAGRSHEGGADIVAIAASTGGPQALTVLLRSLGPIATPIVIALHMPEFFTASFAQMLRQDTGCAVQEGSHGLVLAPGSVVLIPGGRDGVIVRHRAGGYELRLVKVAAKVHPSGDALLESAAMMAKSPVGIVLTGMGEDGARGAAALARRKAPILVQEPSSCVVDGMPRAAIAAADGARVLPLEPMAAALAAWCARKPARDGNPPPSDR